MKSFHQSPRAFRFGVIMASGTSRSDWITRCRRVESLGYDVIQVPDHLTLTAPFPAALLAASVTSRVRVSTYVLNAAFWNSAVLAREVATIDEFTDGRFELGLGAGYSENDFDAAGIPRQTVRARVDHLRHTVTEVRRLIADPQVVSRPPIQQPSPPLLIAGQSYGVLDLVAKHADIAGFTGGRVKKADLGRVIPHDLESLIERVSYLWTAAGPRAENIELNIAAQMFEVTDNRTAVANSLSASLPDFSTDEILRLPTYLIGSVDQIATQLLALREAVGISYITVADAWMDDFAPVIDKLR